MLIDWFTVIAQAINFLILVWLMKRYLYRPILDAVDAREKRIAAQIADAAAKEAAAQGEREEFRRKNEEFVQQRAALWRQASAEANVERERLLGEARKAADSWSTQRKEALNRDAHNLNQAIRRQTQEEVFAIARKALKDLAATSLEERLGELFTRRLHTMESPARETFRKALLGATGPALVRSAFELPAEQRAAIQKAIHETFSAPIDIRFETTPDLVSGIELAANGQRLAWSIADYLTAMEKDISELLDQTKTS